ncbi:MAG: YceI family protein [Mariprofundaceae bacterium]
MKLKTLFMAGVLVLVFQIPAQAAEETYDFDIKGQHAFIQFKIKHLGYSWLLGRFNSFNGSFTVDDFHSEKNTVTVEIDVASLDSNHAERDKHLRSADFFDVATFPKATFVSTGYEDKGFGKGIMTGNLTLHGVTEKVTINMKQIGKGLDPWGGFRRGFEGATTLSLSDYKMKKAFMLGPSADKVRLFLSIEGVRK